MVLTHVTDSWTSRDRQTIRTVLHTALHRRAGFAAVPVSRGGRHRDVGRCQRRGERAACRAGAALARRRGWEIFALGLVFRVQAQVLGFAPLMNLFKVDMLNTMGLSIVARLVSVAMSRRSPSATRALAFATDEHHDADAAGAVRSVGWRRCPIRSRPTCGRPDPTRRFRCSRGRRSCLQARSSAIWWMRRKTAARRTIGLQSGCACGGAGAWLAWTGVVSAARCFRTRRSGTIRRRFSSFAWAWWRWLVPVAWVVERLLADAAGCSRS